MSHAELKVWSLFSGIAGFDLGLERSGMKCVLQVERDKNCIRVLTRHYPEVRRINDVNRLRAMLEPRNAKRFVSTEFIRPDIIAGGFPCQDLSVAGKRAGLAGARSGLWFTFRRIIALVKPEFVLIENVPGLLSSWSGDSPSSLGIGAGPGREMVVEETSDLSVVLDGLAKCGYGFAYRTIDAQYFGVPQRRRRVFIVGCLGNWKRASQILFESDSLCGNYPPSQEAGAGVAPCVRGGTESGSNEHGNKVVGTLSPGAHPGGANRQDAYSGQLIVNSVTSKWATGSGGPSGDECQNLVCEDTAFTVSARDGKGANGNANPGNFVVGRPLKSGGNMRHDESHETYATHALTGEGHDASEDGTGRGTPLVFDTTQITSPGNYSQPQPGDPCHPLATGAHPPAVAFGWNKSPSQTMKVSDVTDPIMSSRCSQPAVFQCHGSNVGPMGTLRSGNGNETGGVPFTIQERACSESERSGPGGKGFQEGLAFTLEARHKTQSVANRSGVRRLTPLECERLMGFPDGWTQFDADGKQIADSPRYRMCGNSIVVNVATWIGRRLVESASQQHGV